MVGLVDAEVVSEDLQEVVAALGDVVGQQLDPVDTHQTEQGVVAPLELGAPESQLDSRQLSPQHLDDFALGFSLTEGIVDSATDLLDVEVTPHTLEGGAAGLTVDLRVTQRCFMRLKEKRRNLTGRTGCGLCGTENLSEAVRPVPARVPS